MAGPRSGYSLRGPLGPRHFVRSLATRRRAGFTLVELLVVITIIGMLMAMLLPAIQSAREAGRRNTCSNNIRNLGTALLTIEGTKRGFPGYANVVGNKRASWIVPILPNLERTDLYQRWLTTPMDTAYAGLPESAPWANSYMNVLVCPSNPVTSESGDALAYACNTGVANNANNNLPPIAGAGGPPLWNTPSTVYEDVNSGVFFNQAGADVNASNEFNLHPANSPPASGGFQPGGLKATMDFVSANDGSSYTLMLAENLQASHWATDPLIVPPAAPKPFRNEFQIRQAAGFAWFITGENAPNNGIGASAGPTAAINFDTIGINGLAQAAPVPSPIRYNQMSATTGGLACARPSSQHPGGVNVLFCDGHHRFLAEELPYHVYTQLMTPKQASVRINVGNQTANQAWNTNNPALPYYTLSETDY